jgi:hypothetical protein
MFLIQPFALAVDLHTRAVEEPMQGRAIAFQNSARRRVR